MLSGESALQKMPARSKYKSYDLQVLQEAVDAVKSKQMSIRKASKHFGIAQSTLGDKVKGKTSLVKTPQTILTPEEEDKFVKWLVNMAEVGFGQSTEDIRLKVKAIIELRGGTTNDPNNMPSQSWVYHLMKRYSQLSLR